MKKFLLLTISALLTALLGGCTSLNKPTVTSVAAPSVENGLVPIDHSYVKEEGMEVIYVAGGCFWGTEKLMQTLYGVKDATSGYANGEDVNVPSYETVSDTGFKETVRVVYDPEKVSLDTILFVYFRSIDPSITNRQGNDIGTQYQAGIYWADDKAKETVLRIADVERERANPFAVEIEPLRSFYDAEEYHQNYLDKNVNGYCHITTDEFELAARIIVDPVDYPRPSKDEIKAKLTEFQYSVTQEEGTEPAFQNEYWNHHERGIYVDVVTGEPLFSSSDKFDSGTGWPSFSKGIDENTFVFLADHSFGMERVEARSRTGDTHLGHVFTDDSKSSTGIRYCMNSASLRFIPYDNMEKEGYGYLKEYVL